MPDFSYVALDANGGKIKGTLGAPSKTEAMDRLTGQGYLITQLAQRSAAKQGPRQFRLPWTTGVSASELVLMIRRLATMVGSDIPLSECLKALSVQVESQVLREVLTQVKDDVQQGHSFSNALTKHARIFSPMVISMTRVAETGGILGPVLDQLADFLERDREIRSEVKAALAYPIMVMGLAVVTIIILMTFVVPRLTSLFLGMKATLPLPTVILMKASGFFQSYIWYLLPVVAAAAAGLHYWRRSPDGKLLLDRAVLRVPLIGALTKKTAIARFSRSLGALLRGGVPLMEALDVMKGILNNEVLNHAVERMKDRVRRGDEMAQGLEGEELFPEMVRYMIAAGESTGKLDDMLFKIADTYEMETRQSVKVLLSLLAPLLILAIASFVGFIAVAMLLPILELNKMIS